jgi:hypothetical protein
MYLLQGITAKNGCYIERCLRTHASILNLFSGTVTWIRIYGLYGNSLEIPDYLCGRVASCYFNLEFWVFEISYLVLKKYLYF